ncbi:hypothetical protein QBC43DRAFT_359839 [Cladorrhinum sp. PSN259]|nr:hypothetical protein QBC43DRAFT_359839 [Cladorrhinum sp. PSN259]
MHPLTPILFGLITPFVSVAAESTPHEVTKDFTGRGQIHILKSDSFFDASPEQDRIGCLNEQGLLTQKDCAVFTRKDVSPHTLSSPRGDCSFRNANMPSNKDSWYGTNTHAWSCGRFGKGGDGDGNGNWDGVEEFYYTVNGFRYPFVCNGNINCYYDIPRAPTENETVQPVWQYYWGGEQPGITPGHLQVLWLWVPVGRESV